MEVIYFSKERPGRACRLLEAVGRGAGERPMTAFSDIEEFKREVSGRRGRKSVAVIVARDEQTLIDVYFARSLLSGVLSVLILPDHERLTTALAFRIRPDYTLFADAAGEEVAFTVRNILREMSRGYTPSRDHAAAGGQTPHGPVPGNGHEAANF